MVQWAEKLYIGDKMSKRAEYAIDCINRRKALMNVFCISFASNEDNLFDIMDVNQLLFPYYKDKEIKIVGLAKGREEAIEIVHDMIMEVYKERGDFDVRSYFT